jgi:DUF4097 and DUF4098 domain-containing protein YvlB
VRLEIANGSGSAQVRIGQPGEVRVRADVRVRAWLFGDARSQLQEILKNPPVEQRGNLIHIGLDRQPMRSLTANYTIVVPAETELQAFIGSGSLEVRGIRGPAQVKTGSGSIALEDIREDVQALAGSGAIAVSRVDGEVRATAGSGGITLAQIRGEIRALAGSGGITIDDPGGRITARTGSGGIAIAGAGADLRASASSGRVTIEGNPSPSSFWELRSGSGGVELRVPADASFRLYAHSGSGRIETSLPLVIEEQSRREIRARVGSGAARIEARTGSGSILIR